MLSGREKLQRRVKQLEEKVVALRSHHYKIGSDDHRYFTGSEISEMDQDQEGADRLAGMPAMSLKQVGLLCRAYDIQGRATRPGVKKLGGFCGALQRHRTQQLCVASHELVRKARALRKVIKHYVERPGR